MYSYARRGAVDRLLWEDKPAPRDARRMRHAGAPEPPPEAYSTTTLSVVGAVIIFVLIVTTILAVAGFAIAVTSLAKLENHLDGNVARVCNVACPTNKILTITNSALGYGIVNGFNHTFANDGTLRGSAILSGESGTMVGSNFSVIIGSEFGQIVDSDYSLLFALQSRISGFNGSVALGGKGHHLSGPWSAIIGGVGHNNSALESGFMAGGEDNLLLGRRNVLLGGTGLSISAEAISDACMVGGGPSEIAGGVRVCIIGGRNHYADAEAAIILGGQGHNNTGSFSAMVGGNNNENRASRAAVVGGDNCGIITAAPFAAGIFVGRDHIINDGDHAVVLGGSSHTMNASNAAVVGGSNGTVGDGAQGAVLLGVEDVTISGNINRFTAHASNLHTLGMLRASSIVNVTIDTYTLSFGDFMVLCPSNNTIEFPSTLPDGMIVSVRLDSTANVTLTRTGTANICPIGGACATSFAMTTDFDSRMFIFHDPSDNWYEI